MDESLSELWSTVERQAHVTYTDARGKEQQEVVQDLPPPSLMKGGAAHADVHRLEQLTGTFASRPPKREVESVEAFDDDQQRAQRHPLLDSTAAQQARAVALNRKGVQEAAEPENFRRDRALYNGYNVANPELTRKTHLPVTNRSFQPDSNWESRGRASALETGPVLGEAPPSNANGLFDSSFAEQQGRAAHARAVGAPLPQQTLSTNQPRSTAELMEAARADVNRQAIAPTDTSLTPRSMKQENEQRHAGVRAGLVQQRVEPAQPPLTAGRDAQETKRQGAKLLHVNAPGVRTADNDLAAERVFDDAVARQTTQAFQLRTYGSLALGTRDATSQNRFAPNDTGTAGRTAKQGSVELFRDRAAQGRAAPAQPGERYPMRPGTTAAPTRPELHTGRILGMTHNSVHASASVPEARVRPENAVVGRVGLSTFLAKAQPLLSSLSKALKMEPGNARVGNEQGPERRAPAGQQPLSSADARDISSSHTREKRGPASRAQPGERSRPLSLEVDPRPNVAPQLSDAYGTVMGLAPRSLSKPETRANAAPLPSGAAVHALPSEVSLRRAERDASSLSVRHSLLMQAPRTMAALESGHAASLREAVPPPSIPRLFA